MISPVQLYNANVGHTHEAAIQAVWDEAVAWIKAELASTKADVQAVAEVVEEVAPAATPVIAKVGL